MGAIFMLVSCKTLEVPLKENLIISMERTECPDACPVYTLEVYNNGIVLLTGKEHIEKIGTYISQIPKSDITNMVNIFNEYGFFDFKEKYYSNVSDLPTTHIYFSDQGREKKIMDYDGAPEELKYLESRVSQLLSLSWKRVQDTN
ncbi:MAG: DUF6438 domain-containing protein [Cyclobacteriaceae bacterium]